MKKLPLLKRSLSFLCEPYTITPIKPLPKGNASRQFLAGCLYRILFIVFLLLYIINQFLLYFTALTNTLYFHSKSLEKQSHYLFYD